MMSTIAAGGAESDDRARRFMKEARRVTGRCLLIDYGG
jgi:hypothetical protein